MKSVKEENSSTVSIFAHPEVCSQLTSEDFFIIENLEESLGKQLTIRADNSYHIEQYEIFIN